MREVTVGVLGASGYTGAELLRLLAGHPHAKVTLLCGRAANQGGSAGQTLGEALPAFRGVPFLGDRAIEPFDAAKMASRCDVAFSCLPHGANAGAIRAFVERGVRALDLSADLRLHDPETHRRHYGDDPAAELRAQAVYGLPELHREKIREARVVAVPGCYPTSAILPLAPLLQAGLVEPTGIVVDSKSGVSGAGRAPTASTHFPEVAEGLRAYKVGEHRHAPEIEQELSAIARTALRVTFTPHLVPMNRGILTTAYARPRGGATAPRAREAARAFFRDSPWVVVLDPPAWPDTLNVRATNRAHLAYADGADHLIALCAIDNLTKGASGQALQCMNLMFGLDETAGLGAIAVAP